MSLQEKAIDIKGKKYVLVSDRIVYFNEQYKSGSITTELVSSYESDYIVIKATVLPDNEKPNRIFTAYSQAVWDDGYINKTSALENAETSAVGRALGFMGIGVIDSVASVDEINKTTHKNFTQIKKTIPVNEVAKEKQTIKELCDNLDVTLVETSLYKEFVKEVTDLELIPANFKTIINKLKEIK